MNKEIFLLLKRTIYFFLPFFFIFLFFLLLYLIYDPFKVIKKYESYYVSDEIQGVVLNRCYVSTSTFENYNSLHHYNSFIFGNSRSFFYRTSDWKSYLDTCSSCFHFNATAEPLYGMYKKILFLDNNNVDIKNALFITDYGSLYCTTSNIGLLFMISPQLENYKNIYTFHSSCIESFFNIKFLVGYFNFKIRGKIDDEVLDNRIWHYDLKENELSIPIFEKLIDDGEFYTPERMRVFYDRDLTRQTYSPVVIFDKQKQILQEINDIFKKHNTDFKIIINPLYDQKKINESDLIYLQSLFGKDRVYDFSGINDITNDFHNYYEDSHYRPHVARKILDSIYRK